MPLAGQDVANSGIYRAAHAGHDEQDGEVVLLRGERFPRCSTCDYGIHYTLIHAAPGVAEIPEFSQAKPKRNRSAAA
jgi:hypothetical protein